MRTILLVMAVVLAHGAPASAGTDCTTRKSGSVTITTCTDTRAKHFSQCRSYMSGSVRKTSCRS